MPILIVDIREESEILDVQIKPNTPEVHIVNIPSRSIFANVEYLNRISENYDQIYLLCRTSRRTSAVKEKYFHDNPKIHSYPGGWKALEDDDDLPKLISIVDSSSLFNLAPQQYMQIVIVCFLLSIIAANYMEVPRKYVNIAIGGFAAFICYQVLTKDCTMANLIALP